MRIDKWIALLVGLLACGLIATGCGGYDVEGTKDAFVENCTTSAQEGIEEADLTEACEAGAEAIGPCIEDNSDLGEDEVIAKCDPIGAEAVGAKLTELGYQKGVG